MCQPAADRSLIPARRDGSDQADGLLPCALYPTALPAYDLCGA